MKISWVLLRWSSSWTQLQGLRGVDLTSKVKTFATASTIVAPSGQKNKPKQNPTSGSWKHRPRQPSAPVRSRTVKTHRAISNRVIRARRHRRSRINNNSVSPLLPEHNPSTLFRFCFYDLTVRDRWGVSTTEATGSSPMMLLECVGFRVTHPWRTEMTNATCGPHFCHVLTSHYTAFSFEAPPAGQE